MQLFQMAVDVQVDRQDGNGEKLAPVAGDKIRLERSRDGTDYKKVQPSPPVTPKVSLSVRDQHGVGGGNALGPEGGLLLALPVEQQKIFWGPPDEPGDAGFGRDMARTTCPPPGGREIAVAQEDA